MPRQRKQEHRSKKMSIFSLFANVEAKEDNVDYYEFHNDVTEAFISIELELADHMDWRDKAFNKVQARGDQP